MHFRSPSAPSQTAAVKVHILNFKITWSEFQKPSQTAAKLGIAELRILDFKTTWSEFQKPSQTAAMQGEAELRIYILKKHHLPIVSPKQLCAPAHLGCTRAAGTS